MASTVDTASLSVILPRPFPHQPIRAIDATTFDDLHTAHKTADVPDSVLFPFMHGLEGDNYQQNAFFAASSGLNVAGNGAGVRGEYAGGGRASNVVKVPCYRGVMWVACDEGQQRQLVQGQANSFSHPEDIDSEDGDGDYDFGYDSMQSTSHQSHFPNACGDDMQVDNEDSAHYDHELAEPLTYDAAHVSEDAVDATEDANAASHMHPLALRKLNASPPISINTGPHPSHTSFASNPHGARAASAPTSSRMIGNANPQVHPRNPDARRLSTASSDSASSSSSSSRSTSASGSQYFDLGTSGSYSTTASSVEDKDTLFDGENGNDSPTTPCTSPLTDICIDDCIPNVPDAANNAQGEYDEDSPTISSFVLNPYPETCLEHAFPDVDASRLTITSSFKPDDLLTIDPEDGSHKFVDPRVPDGISLRNFGIQTVSVKFTFYQTRERGYAICAWNNCGG